MLTKDAIRIDLRYPEVANILVFDDNSQRFETCCFTYPHYNNNIISISVTSDGCAIGCKFCDVPNAGPGKNLTADQMESQVILAQGIMNQCPWVNKEKPLKIAFNRAGEPLNNPHIYEALERFSNNEFENLLGTKPSCLEVVSVMPNTSTSNRLLDQMTEFSKTRDTNFYIQASMHTSDEAIRKTVIPYRHLISFKDIAEFGKRLYMETDKKRQMTLTFHLMENLPVITSQIREIFDPTHFRIRIAYYSPTTPTKKQSFPRSDLQRIEKLVTDFRIEGYNAYSSLISPGEHIVNTHPGSGLSLLTHLENQK